MQFKDLKLSLKEKIKPCYLLSCGNDNEDLFLKSSCINNIKNAVLTDFIDLNLNIFTNENLDVNNFKKSLETLPFLSEKKLILIKENETIKNLIFKKKKKKEKRGEEINFWWYQCKIRLIK